MDIVSLAWAALMVVFTYFVVIVLSTVRQAVYQ